MRDYSCFCDSCIDEDYQECINQTCGRIGAWISVPLDVTDTFDKDDENFDDIPLISDDYNHISGLVKVGKYDKYLTQLANYFQLFFKLSMNYFIQCTCTYLFYRRCLCSDC